MKKYTALILVLVLVGCLFTGCGCQASVEPTVAPTTQTTSAPTQTTTHPTTHPTTAPTMDTTHDTMVPEGSAGMDMTDGHVTEGEGARTRRPY